MKRFNLLIVIIIIATGAYAQPWLNNLPQNKKANELTLYDYQNAFNEYWEPFNVDGGYYIENGVKKKASGWKQFNRWAWDTEGQTIPKTGEFPTKTAQQVYEEYQKANPQQRNSKSANWTVLGPNSSGGGYAGIGRLNCIAFHPTDNNTYWAGAASGGIWKTINNGSTWTCLTDDNGVLAISDIVIPSDYAASNTIYIATGDKDAWDNRSTGVLKSTDGGATWNTTGLSYSLADSEMVARLLLNPSDNNTIIAATSNGVYKTTNGGTTWSTQLTSTDFIDMEYKPGDFNTFYGSTKYGEIYVSTNGGSSWTQTFSNGNRIELAVTPDNSNMIYAVVVASDNGLYGVYQSVNSGSSFSEVFSGSTKNLLGWNSDGNDSGGQGWYDLALAVSPADANTIVIGGINTWRSTNGGTTWSVITHWWGDGVQAVHADVHQLNYRSNGDLFNCNDGGIYYSNDNGTNFTDKTDGMVISQMYRLGVSETDAGEVITGLQDNGTKLISSGTWNDVKGGDGMECLIDYTNVNTQYGTYVYGQISRTTDHWGSSTDIEPAGHPGAWVTPYIIDPTDHNTLYAGYANVWKTTNQGSSWTEISNMNSSGKLRSMAIAHSNTSVLYVADYYNIWKTTNGGTSWTDITGSLPVGSASIRYIAVKNNDENTLWIAMSGYNSDAVYESTNGGTSWTNISTGLPEIPAYSIVQNTQVTSEVHLYAGTELGVYFKKGTDNWIEYNTGLPNVKIGEIEIYYDVNPANSKLIAATYGRGLWETPVEEIISIAFPAPENLVGTLNGEDADLSWDSPSTPNTAGVISYTDIGSITHYMGTHIIKGTMFQSDAGFNFPVTVTKLSHGFYNPNDPTPWTDATFRFRIYSEDLSTIFYESPDIEAVHYTEVEHILNDPIILTSDFFVGVVTTDASGEPHSLSELVPVGTAHGYINDGTDWFYVNDWEFLTSITIVNAKGEQKVSYANNENYTNSLDLDLLPKDTKIYSITNPYAGVKSALTGYKVYKDGSAVGGTLPATQTTYTDADICGSYDYYVTAIYIGDDGESDASNTETVENPLPTAPTSASASLTVICSGDNTSLTYTGGSGDTFTWYTGSCGGTSVGTGNNLSVSPTVTTTYYGRWENACGNSTCESVEITVNDVPAQPSTISGEIAPCESATETYSVTNVSGVTYAWDLPTGWTGSSTTNSINVTVGATSGNVTVTPSNDCGTGTAQTLAVTPNTNITAITDQPDDANVSVGDDVSFTVVADGDNLTYQWRFEGSDITGANQATYQILTVTTDDAGNYDVTVTGDCGQETSDEALLTVITSIEELIDFGINIYPNPSTGLFIVTFSDEIENVNVTITNITGKSIYKELLKNSGKNTVDLSGEAKGIYLIKFNLGHKTVISTLILE